jgi:glycine cleavage system regulatory protein
MQVSLVMTVLGKDRPGLVESLARLVAEHDGNWLESRMCRLGGEFAGILRVHVPADRQAALEKALSTIGAQGLQVTSQPDPGEPVSERRKLASLEIIGQDRPGIVRQITAALASHQVNVEEFRSECSSAPMTGETLFKAEIEMQIPLTCDMAALRRELEKIAGDLLVDVSLEEWLTSSRSKS